MRPTWICNNLTLAWTYSAPCTLSVCWILICRKYFFVIFAFYFRSYSPFWDGKVCLESLPVYSLSPINMIESGTVKKITGWTFVSGDKPIRVCLCYIVFCYISIHTKIYSLKSYVINFYTPMSSNQSESRSMFFFYMREKWYVQWNATAMHEFRSKFPAFVWACSTFCSTVRRSQLCVFKMLPSNLCSQKVLSYTSKLVLEFFSLYLFSCIREERRSPSLGPIVWSKLNKHI